MSSKFESGIRQIDAPQEKVYETLSNLQNLERVKDRIPEDKLQNLVFDNDSIGIEHQILQFVIGNTVFHALQILQIAQRFIYFLLRCIDLTDAALKFA